MDRRSLAVWLLVVACCTGIAFADHKVVKESHTDPFDIMGQAQPEKNVETVTWVGPGRLRADTATVSFIVRLDLERMYLVNHTDQTFAEIPLPANLTELMAPEMVQMMSAMAFKATVKPRDETRTVEGWSCRGYDVELSSSAMTMRSTMWVTTDVDVDIENLAEMTEQIVRLQPGMADAAAQMKEIKGLRVLQEGVMSILGNEVPYSERVVSIESADPPEGTYEPPAGYDESKLDLAGFMRQSR